MAHRLPVVALHAGGTTPRLWEPLRRAAPDLVLETPDLNALAARLPAEAGYDSLVQALLRELPDEPFVLAGSTIGARIALSAAAVMGDRVRALYLLTPTPVDEDEAFLATLAGLRRFVIDGFTLQRLESIVPVMLYRFGPRFAEASRELSETLAEAAAGHAIALARVCSDLTSRPRELLRSVHAPIEVLFGARDPILDPAWPASWRAAPGVRSFELVADGCHQLALEIPERIAADLRRLAEGG